MSFDSVGVIARHGNHNVAEAVLLVESFLRARGVVLLAEQASQEMLAGPADAVLSRDELGAQCDLIVVVGGDGSLLGVARDFAATGTPVIGVNRGGPEPAQPAAARCRGRPSREDTACGRPS